MLSIINSVRQIKEFKLQEKQHCCGIKSKSYLAISRKDHDFEILHRKSYISQNIIIKIFFWLIKPFWRTYQDVDDLKDLKDLYSVVLKEESLTDSQKTVVKESFDTLKKVFNAYRDDKSINATILSNDILEAFAMALKKGGLNDKFGLNIERVKEIKKVETFDKEIKSYHAPLIKMEDIEEYTKLIKQKFPDKTPTLKEILQDEELKRYIIIEEISMAKIMEMVYRSDSKIIEKGNAVFSNLLTRYFGKNCRTKLKPGEKRTRKLLEFFQKLNISLITNINGELYSYGEIFKKGFRDELSKDEAFSRELNNDTKNLLMQKLKNTVNGITQVISAAFCRLRFLVIEKGDVNKSFSIEGKKLSDSTEEFSIQNMLGNENDVKISFDKNEDILDPDSKNAEYIYLRLLTNYINKHDATLVVQRLSPEDVHHYVEPVGGKVLSLEDVCEVLQSKTENEIEKNQLSKLVKYFKKLREEENISNTKVKISGTKKSVSPVAVQNQSPLSQNDRKIQVVQLKDGSIAIHLFIGAINVNNVDVTRESGPSDLGEEVGRMAFGNDKNKDFPNLKRQSSRDWNKHYNPLKSDSSFFSSWKDFSISEDDDKDQTSTQNSSKNIALGAKSGSFSMKGSTVVSIYFNFKKTDLLKKAEESLKYIALDGKTVRNIEIKTNMFEPIGKIVTQNK